MKERCEKRANTLVDALGTSRLPSREEAGDGTKVTGQFLAKV